MTQTSLDGYFAWEADTRDLCAAGDAGNAWIDEVYARSEEARLLEPNTSQSIEFRRRVSAREIYWRSRAQQLGARIADWEREIAENLSRAEQAGDRLGVARHLCWLINSTLQLAPKDAALESIARRGLTRLQRINRKEATTFRLETKYESSAGFVERRARKLFAKVYRIERPGARVRYVEVVEAWQWATEEQLTFCVPLSVGCPNRCSMCEYGTYFGGHLRSSEILRLIEISMAANRRVPISRDPARMTIYFLGGGDACQHPDLARTLDGALHRWPGLQQVLSTIAADSEDALDRVVSLASARPRVGLQISLCSLDPEVRRSCVARPALPIASCAESLRRFHRLSGRKGRISLFLLPGVYDDPDRIAAQAKNALDPAAVRVTLTRMQENSLQFSKASVSFERYRATATALRAAGFEVSISTNDEDPDNDIACGKSHTVVLGRNNHFQKRFRAEDRVGRCGSVEVSSRVHQ